MNQTLANALAMLARLLRYGRLSHHGGFVNLHTRRTRSDYHRSDGVEADAERSFAFDPELSRNIRIDRNAPSLEQPLRYVASVPIVFAPAPQLIRRRVAILGQAKTACLQLKLGGTRGRSRRRSSAAPAGVAWLAYHSCSPVVVLDPVVLMDKDRFEEIDRQIVGGAEHPRQGWLT